MYEEKNCDNCNRNNNGGQGTLYGLIILVLVCVAGYLYAQNLHLRKEVDHYKYYFDDSYNDSDDDILSQILKPFMEDSDSNDNEVIHSENGHFDENDNWVADPDDGYNNSKSDSSTVDDIDDAERDFQNQKIAMSAVLRGQLARADRDSQLVAKK